MDAKQRIARRVAQELRDGDVVNLGIGLPTMVANYLPADIHITLQSENGFLGLGPVTTAHPDLVNAGGQPCGILPGAAMFDSAMSMPVSSVGCRLMNRLTSPTGWFPVRWCPVWAAQWIWSPARVKSLSPWNIVRKMARLKFSAIAPCH